MQDYLIIFSHICKIKSIRNHGIIMGLIAIYSIIMASMLRDLEEILCIWLGYMIHQECSVNTLYLLSLEIIKKVYRKYISYILRKKQNYINRN